MECKKAVRRSFSLLFALVLAISCCMVPAFAADEELPIDKATSNSATVSDETDKATNEDPDMGTQFFMYIEPDIVVNDHPNMGDTGIDVSLLMMAALAAGTAYLGVSAYANKAEKHMAEIR